MIYERRTERRMDLGNVDKQRVWLRSATYSGRRVSFVFRNTKGYNENTFVRIRTTKRKEKRRDPIGFVLFHASQNNYKSFLIRFGVQVVLEKSLKLGCFSRFKGRKEICSLKHRRPTCRRLHLTKETFFVLFYIFV